MALSSTRRPSMLAAEVVERRLDRGLELDDRAAEVGRHLVGHERVVEHVELAAEQRVGGGRRRRRRGRRGSRRRRRRRRGSARRASSAAVRRASAAGDDRVFDSHHASASSTSSGRSSASMSATRSAGGEVTAGSRDVEAPDPEETTRRPGRRAERHGPWKGREGSGGCGGGEDGAGVAGEGLVDHLALEGDGGLAAGHGIVVGREQAPGPVELLGRRGERPVGERDLGGVDAELAPVAEGAPVGGVGEEVRPRRRARVTTWSTASTPASRAASATRDRAYSTSVPPGVRTPPMSAMKSSAPKYATAHRWARGARRARSTPVRALDTGEHVQVPEPGSARAPSADGRELVRRLELRAR